MRNQKKIDTQNTTTEGEPPAPGDSRPAAARTPCPASADTATDAMVEGRRPIKPMHHLPRGKNTWNPWIVRQWWFWPASAAALYVLYYVYPLIWQWLTD